MTTATPNPTAGAFIRAEILPFSPGDTQIVEWATWQRDMIRLVVSSSPMMRGLRRLCTLLEDEEASGISDETLGRLAIASGLAERDDPAPHHGITGLDTYLSHELATLVPAVADAIRALPTPTSQTEAIETAATVADDIMARQW